MNNGATFRLNAAAIPDIQCGICNQAIRCRAYTNDGTQDYFRYEHWCFKLLTREELDRMQGIPRKVEGEAG